MNTETPEKTSAEHTPGPLHTAVQKACGIIERADARNLASDVAGGQPPRMTLKEWRELYTVLDGARKTAAAAEPDLYDVTKQLVDLCAAVGSKPPHRYKAMEALSIDLLAKARAALAKATGGAL